MLEQLEEIEETNILELLADENGWSSEFANGAQPYHDRMWRTLDNGLHLHLCTTHKCFDGVKPTFTVYPGAFALRVIDGAYIFRSGHDAAIDPEEFGIKTVLHSPSGFEVTDGLHAIYLEAVGYSTAHVLLTEADWDPAHLHNTEPYEELCVQRKKLGFPKYRDFYRQYLEFYVKYLKRRYIPASTGTLYR